MKRNLHLYPKPARHALWFISAESASSFWEFAVCMWQRTSAQMKHKSIAGVLYLGFQNAALHWFSKDTPWEANKSLLTTDAFALWSACAKWWLYENFILIASSVYFKMDHCLGEVFHGQMILIFCCLYATFTLETCCSHSIP